MDGVAFVDGGVQDLATARVPIVDRGYLMGDGIYETLRTANGQVWRADDHRQRFIAGCKQLGLDAEVVSQYDEAIEALVTAGEKKFSDDLYLRINLTTGAMEDIAGGSGAVVSGICKRFQPYPMRHYTHGISVILSSLRHPGGNGAKSMSMHRFAAARREAMSQTAHDAILVDGAQVVEATTSNVFAFRDGIVHAPVEGAVSGVTRKVVLELLAEAELPVQEHLSVRQLEDADEVWLTNSIGGVVPVTRVGERILSSEKGELTGRLGHAYEDLLRGR